MADIDGEFFDTTYNQSLVQFEQVLDGYFNALDYVVPCPTPAPCPIPDPCPPPVYLPPYGTPTTTCCATCETIMLGRGCGVTLAVLRARARSRADMPGANFVTNTELDAWLNEGIATVHDKLAAALGGDYLETLYDFTSDGSEYLDLPDCIYKLIGVDLYDGNKYVTLSMFDSLERNADTPTSRLLPRYKFSGADRIRFSHAPTSGTVGRLWYIPPAPLLVDAGDIVAFPNGWERYAITYAAIQMLLKEESDVSGLMAVLANMDRQLDQALENRNAGDSQQARDVCSRSSFDDYGTL